MPNSAMTVADEVATRARSLDRHLKKLENRNLKSAFTRAEIEKTYAGNLLLFYAFLERSLERLFVGLLCNRFVSGHPNIRPLVQVNSDKVAHAIIRGGRAYADWLPYEHTQKRAEAFFSQGKPFTTLDPNLLRPYQEIGIIRNAIAHQSSSAKNRFETRIIGDRPLPPEQRRPAGYLRGNHTIGQSRINHLFTEVVLTMNMLCK